jgi:hypothetical protein
MKKILFLLLLTFSLYSSDNALEKAIIESDQEEVQEELDSIPFLSTSEKEQLLDLAQNTIETRKNNKLIYLIPQLIAGYIGLNLLGTGIALPIIFASDPGTFSQKQSFFVTGAGGLFSLTISGLGAAILYFTYKHYDKTKTIHENAVKIKQLIHKMKSDNDKEVKKYEFCEM